MMATDFDQFVQRMFNGAGAAGGAAGAASAPVVPPALPVPPAPPVQQAIQQAAQGLPPQLVQMIAQAAQQATRTASPPPAPVINPSLARMMSQTASGGGSGGAPVARQQDTAPQPGKMEGESDYDYLTRRRKEDPTDPRDAIGVNSPVGPRSIAQELWIAGEQDADAGRVAAGETQITPYVWVEYQTPQGPVTFYLPEDRSMDLPTGARVIDPTPVTDPERLTRAYEAGMTYERQPVETQGAFRTSEEVLQSAAAIEARQDNIPAAPEEPISIQQAAAQDAQVAPVDQGITTEEIRAQGATDPQAAALATQLDAAGITRIGPDQEIVQDPQTGALSLRKKEEVPTVDSGMQQAAAENAPVQQAPRVTNQQEAEQLRAQREEQARQQRIDETPALTTTQLRLTNPAAANRLEAAGYTEIGVDQMAVEDAQGRVSLVPSAEQAPEGTTIITYGGASVNPATQRDAGYEGGFLSDVGYSLSGVGTLAGAVLEPLDAPRQKTAGVVGDIALGVANITPDQFKTEGMRRNQQVARDGWDMDGDGLPDVFGGRAVWEMYQNEAPVVARALADIIFDPLNYTPAAGGRLIRAGSDIRIGGATIRQGEEVAGSEVLVPIWRKLTGNAAEGAGRVLRAPDTLVDDVIGNIFGAGADAFRGTRVGKYLTDRPAAGRVAQEVSDARETLGDVIARRNRGDALGQRPLEPGQGRMPEGDPNAPSPMDRSLDLPPAGAPTGQTIAADGLAQQTVQPRLGIGRVAPDDTRTLSSPQTLGESVRGADDSVVRDRPQGVGRLAPDDVRGPASPAGVPQRVVNRDGTVTDVQQVREGVGRVAPDRDAGIVDASGRVISRAAPTSPPRTSILGPDGRPVTTQAPAPATLPDAAPARSPEQLVPAGRDPQRPYAGTALGDEPKPDWGFLAPKDRGGPSEAVRITDRAWELRAQYPERWQQFRAEYDPRAQRFAMEQEGRDSVQYPQGAGYTRYQKDTVAEAAHVVDAVIPAFRRAFGDVEPMAEYRPRYTTDTPLSRKRDNELIETAVFSADRGQADAAMRILESRARKDTNLSEQMPEIGRVRSRYLDQVSGAEAVPQAQLPTAAAPTPAPTVADVPKNIPNPITSPIRGTSKLDIRDVPLDRVTTYRQMARNGEDLPAGLDAQMRDADFSEATANDIATNYNPNTMDPIKIRELPDGRYVVESGHSRFEGFRRRGEPDIPAQVIRGSDEDVRRTALNSNTAGTDLTATEQGRAIRRLIDTGQTVDEVAGSMKIKRAEAERYISTSYLPESSTVRDLANSGTIRLDMASELGRAIRDDVMTPAELDTFYRRVVSPGNLTPRQVREAVVDHAQRRANQGIEGTALFGDDALGGSGFVDSMNARVALRKERASIVRRLNQIEGTERQAGTLTRTQRSTLRTLRERASAIDDDLRLDREAQMVPVEPDAQPSTVEQTIGPPAETPSPWITQTPERSAADIMRESGNQALFADATARPRTLAADASGRTRAVLNPNRMVKAQIPAKPGDRFVGPDTTPWRTVRGRDVYGHEMRGLSVRFNDSPDTLLDRWERYANDLETNGTGKGKNRTRYTAAEADQEAMTRALDEYTIDVLRREDPKTYALYEQELRRITTQLKRPVKDPVAARVQALGVARRGPDKRGLLHAYDTATAVVRETALYSLARGLTYPLTQAVGNTITLLLTGNTDTVVAVLTPRNVRAAYDELQDVPRNVLHSDADRFAAELGIGGKREDVSRIVGRDEGVTERGRGTTTARLADHLRLGKLTAPFANRTVRDLANALDGSSREALWATRGTAAIVEARPVFAQRMTQRLPATITEQQFDDVFNALPQVFGADRVRDAFEPLDAAFARRISGDWQHTIKRVDDAARQEVRRVLFSGEETNLDVALRRVTLFHYWMSRATPLYMAALIKNPGVLNAYAKMIEEMNAQAESGRYGDSVAGFLKVMGSFGGFNLFIRPDAFFQTAYSFYEQAGYTPEGENQFGRFLRESPFMMNPLIETVVNLSGAMGDTWVPDPLQLGTWNRLVSTTIDAAKVRTSDDATPTGLAYSDYVSEFRSMTSGIIPGTEHINAKDSLRGQREINYLIQDIAEEQGLDPLGVEAMAASQDPSHPMYQEAFRRYANANAGLAAARVSPAAVLYPRLRLDRPDELRAGINALPEGDPGRDSLYDQRTAGYLNDPAARALFQQQQEYAALGTPEEQAAWSTYNDIRYGGLEEPVTINGVAVNDGSLRRLSNDERERVADLWAQQSGNAERVASIQAQRKTYREAHPELAAYTDWANSVRDYEGGVQGYWEDTAEGNPNAARWLETLDEPMTMDDLERQLTSVEAYHAWKGTQATVFDPNPISVNTGQGQPYSAGAAGTGPGGVPPYETDPVARIEGDLADYQRDMALYDQAAAQVFGEPVNMAGLNPMARSAYDDALRTAGVREPSLSGDARQYLEWAQQQPPNGDRSVAAFVAWEEQFKAQTNSGTGYDLDTLMQMVGQ